MTTHITRHPLIRGGRPCIRNTRVTTATIRRMWEDGEDVPAIAEAEKPSYVPGVFGIIVPTQQATGAVLETPAGLTARHWRSHGMGTVSIPLPHGKFTLIDEQDYNLVSPHHWHILKNGYVVRNVRENGTQRMIYLHRLILNAQLGEYVDHADMDKLNNTRSNLRKATRSQNQANVGLIATNTSGFKGVTWMKKNRRWIARIRSRHLGCFDTPEAAACAYDRAARELYGEFAWLNFPEESV